MTSIMEPITCNMSGSMLTDVPVEVICGFVFPFLSVDDFQALDSAYTNKKLRPLFHRLWKSCDYDCCDAIICKDDVYWLSFVGVRIISVRVREIENIASHAPNLSSLKLLDVENNASSETLIYIAENCPQLEVLRLGDFCHVGLVRVIEQCHQLHTISCWNEGDTIDVLIPALCNHCPHLLHIGVFGVTDSSLLSIASTYPHLQSVTIGGYDITDAGLLAIADKCHDLKSVAIMCCYDITRTSLSAFWATNPNLTDVDLRENIFLSDDIIMLLQCCPQLQKLNLTNCVNITDAAVIAVAEHCPQLTSLNIYCCSKVSDYALIALGQHCHFLKSIDITLIMGISDVGISVLAIGCPLLREFRAIQTNISDAGVIALARGCRDLRKIDMCCCKSIGLSATSAIAKNCPLISEIDLHCCKSVDDACLYIIAQHCRNLTWLDVSDTKVSDATAVQAIITSCCVLKEVRCLGCGLVSARGFLKRLRCRVHVAVL